MSQRGHTPRPASQPSSPPSPSQDLGPSPALQRSAQPPRDEHRREAPFDLAYAPSTPSTDSEDRRPYSAQRTLGVRNILNPSESRSPGPGAHRAPVSAGSEGGGPLPNMALGQDEGGGVGGPQRAPFVFQGQPAPPPQTRPGFPPSSQPLGPHPPERGGSPTSSHPHPALGGPRRMPTPRSQHQHQQQRGAGPGRSLSLAPFGTHAARLSGRRDAPPMPPVPGPATTTHPTGAQHHGPPLTSGMSPATLSAGATPPPRSLSQPLYRPGSQPRPLQEPPAPQGTAPREQPGRPPFYGSGTTFGPGLPPGASLAAGGPTGDGQWTTALMRGAQPGRPRLLSGSDAQQFITITPTYGEEMHVPVDTHAASKQADYKRQRNAGASARFRQRKKEKDKVIEETVQRLEAQSRELQRRLHEAELEREFYRAERNRLRTAMYQAPTPGMREIADSGPPSPMSTARSGGSFATENSPMAASLQPQNPSLPSYVTEPSTTHERPARRRRTEPSPALEFSIPSYGSPMGATLPPIPSSGFAVAPSPLSAGAAGGGQRLPPLRMHQPSLSPTSEHPPSLPPAPTAPPGPPSQFPPSSRPPYETGWVTGPRPPYDPSPR